MDDLIHRIQAASGPDRLIDFDIALLVGTKTRNGSINIAPHFTASIDAALTLVPEGMQWSIKNQRSPKSVAQVGAFHEGSAATPALALCAAALRAHALP